MERCFEIYSYRLVHVFSKAKSTVRIYSYYEPSVNLFAHFRCFNIIQGNSFKILYLKFFLQIGIAASAELSILEEDKGDIKTCLGG